MIPKTFFGDKQLLVNLLMAVFLISINMMKHIDLYYSLKTNGLQSCGLRKVTIWEQGKFTNLSHSALLNKNALSLVQRYS